MYRTNLTPLTFRSVIFGFFVIAFAASIRIWPLGSLESKLAWLTFYPAVMIASVYGGLMIGLLSTVLSCTMIVFLWQFISPRPFVSESSDWLGLGVFVMTSIMIAVVSEAMRQANVRAKQAEELARAANLAKSVFLANMSHELRTPLNAVLGYSQLMQKDRDLSPENKEYLEIINTSGEHLLALINDVLEISKIESNRANIEISDFNLHVLIENLQKMFRMQAVEKNIALEFRGLEQMPQFLIGDEKLIKIILINLIGNAIKFTREGGVQVNLTVETYQSESHLVVEVIDTGEGVAQNEMSKLFKYFMQTESGKKSNEGTGLGLAISRDYARLMGGDITAISESGKGSCFQFTSKIHISNVSALAFKEPNREVVGVEWSGNVPKVLVAEDVLANRKLLVKILERVGFEVREAANGMEAVSAFQNWRPDFIWMDIRMPVMDGLEATRRIRAEIGGDKVKVVALSAHVFEDEVVDILAAGCDAFVSKPFKIHEIFETLARYLDISYRYKDSEELRWKGQVIDQRDVFLLDHMPRYLVRELGEAVISLDEQRMKEVINKIGQIDTDKGTYLLRILENMDYTRILDCVKVEKQVK